MKLPAVCPKIKKGQIWLKRDSIDPPFTILIIKKAPKGKNGNNYYHTVRLENRKNAHAVSDKDIWRWYELIGHNN